MSAAKFFPILAAVLLLNGASVSAQTWDVLSESEKATLQAVLQKWETWVPQLKSEGVAPLMTFKELYNEMSNEELKFLERVRTINPKKTFGFKGDYLGSKIPEEGFSQIKGQLFAKEGKQVPIDSQYLPGRVFEAYAKMTEAMQKDLGKKLLVESGYRSPAYQLYTFLFYVPKHNFSLAETGRWVAVPGYSEHGAPQQQAIDFINEEGINGEDNPEEFEALPEYKWLTENAGRYGFVLSYPRSQAGITFEPWHWSYRPEEGTRGSRL